MTKDAAVKEFKHRTTEAKPANSNVGPPNHSSLVGRAVGAASQHQILVFLISFRLLNSLTIKTFFQPDEYFQSLEPAWQMVFGEEGGAWITWEWQHRLRSSIHPAFFATLYYLTSQATTWLHLSSCHRAQLMIVTPKTAQACIAALGDFYTWKLAERVYGKKSRVSRTALVLTIVSAWQWFCSTRTLSNCLETTLTISALYFWPFQWAVGDAREHDNHTKSDDLRSWGISTPGAHPPKLTGEETILRICLSLAALACILRPTNLLIWMGLSSYVLVHARGQERITFIREAALCGACIFAVSTVVDRLFYGMWTFPPLRFLYFNIAQSLAIFYGKNDWHYYLSQGLPLLLTTALPFTLIGFYRALSRGNIEPTTCSLSPVGRATRFQMATVSCFVIAVLSLVSHKEVRFIYPLLPIFHLLAAESLCRFYKPTAETITSPPRSSPRCWKMVFLGVLLVLNVFIGYYTTVVHQSGVVSVLDYLRQRQEAFESRPRATRELVSTETSVLFLMPCHSTPWRSHLVHPSIHAISLGCEPPVNMSPDERERYVDEADRFYEDPVGFMRREGANLTTPSRFRPPMSPSSSLPRTGSVWPDCIVFFEQLQEVVDEVIQQLGVSIGQPLPGRGRFIWTTFNSHWHDDSRRRGDVIASCSSDLRMS